MNLYVAEQELDENKKYTIRVVEEISQEELDSLNKGFAFCGIRHSITEIKNIVMENGENFKSWMNKENLRKQYAEGMTSEKIVLTANKLILNYAASLKTYVDIEIRILSQNKKKELERFNNLTHTFYDNKMEYRFWMQFRNYVVHCAFPYTEFRVDEENGVQVICEKKHLLEFQNWKQAQVDVEKMNEMVDLTQLIDPMSTIIYEMYIDFHAIFGKEIVDGNSCYAEFRRKHGVKHPIIMKSRGATKIDECRVQPLMEKELCEAFEILRKNPNVKINVV